MATRPLLKDKGLNKISGVCVVAPFASASTTAVRSPRTPWKTVRTKGAQAIPEKTVEINGAKHKVQIFNGTKLLMVIMSAAMVL